MAKAKELCDLDRIHQVFGVNAWGHTVTVSGVLARHDSIQVNTEH